MTNPRCRWCGQFVKKGRPWGLCNKHWREADSNAKSKALKLYAPENHSNFNVEERDGMVVFTQIFSGLWIRRSYPASWPYWMIAQGFFKRAMLDNATKRFNGDDSEPQTLSSVPILGLLPSRSIDAMSSNEDHQSPSRSWLLSLWQRLCAVALPSEVTP